LVKVVKYLNGVDEDYVKFAIVLLRTYLANLVQDKDAYYLTENPNIINRLLELLGNNINDFNTIVIYFLLSLKFIG
jgi:hypothetical protein